MGHAGRRMRPTTQQYHDANVEVYTAIAVGRNGTIKQFRECHLISERRSRRTTIASN
jgi:hypothetical protein